MLGRRSSSTSSRTSGNSYTSDRPGDGPPAQPRLGAGRLAGLVRLGHPFPSLLNAFATLILATLAGGSAFVALRLSASMLALQVSIGALNDLVDAAVDSGRKPGKPIPRGMARPAEAEAIALIGFALGIGLSAISGVGTALVAAAGAACGYVYDVRLSRSPWSWLPLAVALPLVPVHAWLGAVGAVPPSLVPIIPAGLLAGVGLSLANGLADEGRDRAAGLRTATVAIGRRRAWLVHALALTGTVIIAIAAGPALGVGNPGGDPWHAVAMTGSVALIVSGALLARTRGAAWRERGWELEAVGIAVLAVAWLAGTAGIAGIAGG